MNTLSDICAAKRLHIAKRKAEMPESRLLEESAQASPPRGLSALCNIR